MLNFKNALAAVTMAIGIAGAAPASAAVFGGVDFGTAQGTTHLETATLAQTFINGNNENAQAYGFITTVNGSTSYCVNAPCGLYYVANFNHSENFSNSYVEFTSATVSVYYLQGAQLNLLNNTSPVNFATIQTFTPWVSLVGHVGLGATVDPLAVVNANGAFTGLSLTGFGNGLLDVNTGGPGMSDVITKLNSNGEADVIGGFADIAFTSSFNNSVLSNADVNGGLTTGCKTGTAAVGSWCYQGTSNLRGQVAGTVPEPGALGLLGLSMLGIVGFVRRRKS